VDFRQACSILGISQDSNYDDAKEAAKKKWKKVAAKLHPDVNKEPDAEKKFKEANEAYQFLTSDKNVEQNSNQDMQDFFSHFRNAGNPFGHGQSKVYFAQSIDVSVRITFAESVLGCQKEIKLNRKIKCDNCNGQGHVAINNGCQSCNGSGRITVRNGGMIYSQTCSQCGGRTSSEACKACSSNGVVSTESVLQVNIPGGVSNGNVLNLRGVGNYGGSFGPVDQYTDTHLTVQVIPEPDLSLVGKDVLFTLSISLQDALTGCNKIVKTINGYHDVVIPPKSRHREEIIMSNLGVNKVGDQRVILDVKYPDDVSKLIETLNSEVKGN